MTVSREYLPDVDRLLANRPRRAPRTLVIRPVLRILSDLSLCADGLAVVYQVLDIMRPSWLGRLLLTLREPAFETVILDEGEQDS